jgi:glycosyltransferase involved in cell wall biosynthesis/peptidoglycan/xylan/chitin deacetylase (PgdA/CDA1 family)
MTGIPTASVAVVTRDRVDLLAQTLPTVLEQSLQEGSFEVIVVDDGSSDGTAALVAQHEARGDLRHVRQAQQGIGAARNAAVDAARGAIVVFLDDDLLCEPGLVQAHVLAHAGTPEPLIVVGRLGVAPESSRNPISSWFEAAAAVAHARRSSDMTLRDAFLAGNCSAPVKLIRSSGGFDRVSIKAREEHELGLRLVRAGARPFYEPRAVALEIIRKPLDKLIRDGRAVGGDEVRLCRSYPEYRRYSVLARLADPPPWKLVTRRVTTGSRLVEATLLTAPARLAMDVRAPAIIRETAVALIGARYGVALRRGAVSVAGSWAELEREFGRRLPVLAYHRVGPPVDGANPELTVTPARFQRHLALLRRLRYTPITPPAWLAWCQSGAPLPKRPVLLTFDDAYADLARYAFPELARNGYCATVFAPSAYLGKENSWDEALRAGSHPVMHRLLDAADLIAWKRRGIDVGAHSRTHARLTALDSDELIAEVSGGKHDLEGLLDARVTTFAYPFGAIDERVRDVAVATFDSAFTIEEGLNTLATHPLSLRRSVVRPSDTVLDVLFRVWLGWSPLHRVRLRLARLHGGCR